jgi:hypothetical protein
MKSPHGSVIDVIGVLCHVGMLYRCLPSGNFVSKLEQPVKYNLRTEDQLEHPKCILNMDTKFND